jgi:hypothetical protein
VNKTFSHHLTAAFRAVTPEVVRASWRVTGLWPLDKELLSRHPRVRQPQRAASDPLPHSLFPPPAASAPLHSLSAVDTSAASSAAVSSLPSPQPPPARLRRLNPTDQNPSSAALPTQLAQQDTNRRRRKARREQKEQLPTPVLATVVSVAAAASAAPSPECDDTGDLKENQPTPSPPPPQHTSAQSSAAAASAGFSFSLTSQAVGARPYNTRGKRVTVPMDLSDDE